MHQGAAGHSAGHFLAYKEVQMTPQAFRHDVIRAAYDKAPDSAVDDLALVESDGARVALIPGRQELMKITHTEDFAVVSKLLGASAANMRIGNGFDTAIRATVFRNGEVDRTGS